MPQGLPHPIRSRALTISAVALLAVALVVPGTSSAAAADARESGLSGSELYVDPASTTLEAAQSLTGQARWDAQLLGSKPSATWFTKGTPAEVKTAVDKVVTAATAAGQMPVLVAYNLPFRDCAQYSAGGAADTAAYESWIDAFAAGIADRQATVILEPDGLGIIPHYVTLDNTAEWCQPADAPAATAAQDRFAQLNHAVDALKARASTSVYLDGTGSSWLNVGEISDRLIKGGVVRADGFFLNASNYQYTANSAAFGTWVSSCIAYATEVAQGAFSDCGNQYWNGGPANGWTGVAMSPYGQWSADSADPALNTAGVDSRYAAILNGAAPTTHFVVDTSRNGRGPWQDEANRFTVSEDWCNPPDRGLGAMPTTKTGVPLVDAMMWIKVPGESDGKCYRGTEGPNDPARGVEDPAAGQWFAAQAHELIAFASPGVAALTCHITAAGTTLGARFIATIVIENRSTSALTPWRLSWSFGGTQKVTAVLAGSYVQSGARVTVTAPRWQPTLASGKKTAIFVTGKGAATAPWQFRLNGAPCTS